MMTFCEYRSIVLRLLVATVILKGTQAQKSVLGDKSNNRSSTEGGKGCLTSTHRVHFNFATTTGSHLCRPFKNLHGFC